jgi:Ala-tRNA(Pro) deacylase
MLFDELDKLNIKYEYVKHEEVHTIEEADKLNIDIEGVGAKALFLTDKKDHYYVLVIEENKKADFKKLKEIVGKLSFANEFDEEKILGLKNGGITPMAVCNDIDNKVIVIFDKELADKKILVHPNDTAMTMSINTKDIIKYIEHYNHKYLWY